jgi:hypothetical protein
MSTIFFLPLSKSLKNIFSVYFLFVSFKNRIQRNEREEIIAHGMSQAIERKIVFIKRSNVEDIKLCVRENREKKTIFSMKTMNI